MKSTAFRIFIALFTFLWFLPYSSQGQVIKGDLNIGDTTQVHRVVTKRGDVFLGRVTQIQNTEVHFLFNKTIDLTFQLQDLEEISVVDPKDVGRKYTYDKNRMEFQQTEQELMGYERGFYLPTGFLLPAGAKEYRNMGLLYNSLDFGISDHVNVGIAAVPLILANAIHVRLRAGGSIGDFLHLSANANGYLAWIIYDSATFGAAFTGVASLGSPDRNFTIGGGYGFGFSTPAENGIWVVQFGGSYRLSRSWRLFGEGLVPTNQPGLLLFSAGANWMFGQNRLEFGWSMINADFTIIPFPFIGYGLRF